METLQVHTLVVGAGVIGLAVARELASDREVFVLEAHPQFGCETSSRNSEVVHSGIYYPKDSQKTRFCIEGRELLYRFCETYSVPYRMCGKWVVATNAEETEYLEKLSAHCKDLDVPHTFASGEEVAAQEPLIRCRTAVYLPRTGIVDSHQLMAALERHLLQVGGMVAYRHRVERIEKGPGGSWVVEVTSPEGNFTIEAGWVVNAAGLGAAELSNMALGTSRFEHRYCRGRYFTLSNKYHQKFESLIYPVPQKDGLGTHVTLDLGDQAKLGPDVEWCETVPYREIQSLYLLDWESLRHPFLAAVHKYCPSVAPEDLQPGQVGIRPKLFCDGKAHPDFWVERVGSWIHLLGIESPGLTSSLALAQHVRALL